MSKGQAQCAIQYLVTKSSLGNHDHGVYVIAWLFHNIGFEVTDSGHHSKQSGIATLQTVYASNACLSALLVAIGIDVIVL